MSLYWFQSASQSISLRICTLRAARHLPPIELSHCSDLTLEKAMGWGHAFEMIEDCLGVSKKVLTAMIGAWSRAALMQGMYAARDNRLAVVTSLSGLSC